MPKGATIAPNMLLGLHNSIKYWCAADYFPLLRAPPPGVTINIVRAAKSDRWDPYALQVGRLGL